VGGGSQAGQPPCRVRVRVEVRDDVDGTVDWVVLVEDDVLSVLDVGQGVNDALDDGMDNIVDDTTEDELDEAEEAECEVVDDTDVGEDLDMEVEVKTKIDIVVVVSHQASVKLMLFFLTSISIFFC
jgi:hypothetical protein